MRWPAESRPALLHALGVVCGVLRDRTGSLLAPSIVHFLVWAVLGTA